MGSKSDNKSTQKVQQFYLNSQISNQFTNPDCFETPLSYENTRKFTSALSDNYLQQLARTSVTNSKNVSPRYSPRTNDTSLNSSKIQHPHAFNEESIYSPSSIQEPVQKFYSSQNQLRNSTLRRYQNMQQLKLIPMGEDIYNDKKGKGEKRTNINTQGLGDNSQEFVEFDPIKGQYVKRKLSFVEIIHLDYKQRKSKIANEFSQLDVKNQYKYHFNQFKQKLSDDRNSSILTSQEEEYYINTSEGSSIIQNGLTKQTSVAYKTQNNTQNLPTKTSRAYQGYDINGRQSDKYQLGAGLINQNNKTSIEGVSGLDSSNFNEKFRTQAIPINQNGQKMLRDTINLEQRMKNLNQYCNISSVPQTRRNTISKISKTENIYLPKIYNRDQSIDIAMTSCNNSTIEAKFQTNQKRTFSQKISFLKKQITVFLVDNIENLDDMKKYILHLDVGDHYLSCFQSQVKKALDEELLQKLQNYLKEFGQKYAEVEDFYDRFVTQQKTQEDYPPLTKEEIQLMIQYYENKEIGYRKFFDFITYYFIPQVNFRRQMVKDIIYQLNGQAQYVFNYGTNLTEITCIASMDGQQYQQLFDIPFYTSVIWAGSKQNIEQNIDQFYYIYQQYLDSKQEENVRKRIQSNIEEKLVIHQKQSNSPYDTSPKRNQQEYLQRMQDIKIITNRISSTKNNSPSAIFNIQEKLKKQRDVSPSGSSPYPDYDAENQQYPQVLEIKEIKSGKMLNPNSSNQPSSSKAHGLVSDRLSQMEIKFQNNTVSLVDLNKDVLSNIKPKKSSNMTSKQSILSSNSSADKQQIANINKESSPILGEQNLEIIVYDGRKTRNRSKNERTSPKSSIKSDIELDLERGIFIQPEDINQHLNSFKELDQYLFFRYYTEFQGCMMLNQKYQELAKIPSFYKIPEDKQYKLIYLEIFIKNSQLFQNFSTEECYRIFKAIGTKDIKEDHGNNFVKINLDQFIHIYLLIENQGSDQRLTDFFVNFLNYQNHFEFIPKAEVKEILEQFIGIQNSSSCSPCVYAQTMWKYFQENKLALDDQLIIKQLKKNQSKHIFIYRYLVGWILNDLKSNNKLQLEEILSQV